MAKISREQPLVLSSLPPNFKFEITLGCGLSKEQLRSDFGDMVT
jgi:hypothetical protein